MNEEAIRLGENIRAARLRADLTQADVAKEIGCNQTRISIYESGREMPRNRRLREIASACRTTPEALRSGIASTPAPAAGESPEYNVMLESAKDVIRRHGYEIVSRREFDDWSKIRRILDAQGSKTVRASGDDPLTRL